MANIKANITELRQLLDITPAGHNLMLVGNHGIGKSEILTSYFSQKGMTVVALFLGQMSDPGDLIGLPRKNEQTGKTDFMPPYWFPVDGKPVVLFLDELNRARPEILQTIMDLALNRRLAGRALPEGSRVIAAVNEGDQYQLTDLDPALVSRFNIVQFVPTAQEWLLWAKGAGIDSRVTDFIQENSIWLDKNPDARKGADTGLEKTPDRRGWKSVSEIIFGCDKLTEVHFKAICSIVGPKAANEFRQSVSTHRLVSGRQVLYELDRHRGTLSKYRIHELSVVNESIFRFLETESIPQEDKAAVSANLENYFEMLTKTTKEAAAHFGNHFVSFYLYPSGCRFISSDCPMLTMSRIMYVKAIK